jgi:predicted nuclease of predicted toxin-antitoxin system
MKLLFDENLSPKLVGLLDDLYPNSVHVRDVGLKSADDPVMKPNEIHYPAQ